MNLLTRHHLCQAAPLRFAMQYRDRMDQPLWDGTIPQKIYNKLIDSDLAPESINHIIGNTSWTELTCNACRKTADRVISIDVTGGEYTTHICEECVRSMMGMMDGA